MLTVTPGKIGPTGPSPFVPKRATSRSEGLRARAMCSRQRRFGPAGRPPPEREEHDSAEHAFSDAPRDLWRLVTQ